MFKNIVFVIKIFSDLPKQMRWSYLPPLMVYLAAGISGLTSIVGTFFIKDYLNLTASFLVSLTFWASLPWALKMPLGHLVDLIWKKKNYLVFLGAIVISFSLLIMYGLIAHTKSMSSIITVESWFILSVLLVPIGFVIQDVVADAMTVEAVPKYKSNGEAYSEVKIKEMHTTMQTLGRFAIVGGTVIISLANVILFQGVDKLDDNEKINLYANIYLYALSIPLLSVIGVLIASFQKRNKFNNKKYKHIVEDSHRRIEINWTILIGSLLFVFFSVGVGALKLPYAQEIVFCGSTGIILFLMSKLISELEENQRLMIVGTAIIIFVFRAIPIPGPALTWFEIDQLFFNEHFISILTLLSSVLALIGIIVLRPFMSNNSIPKIIIILSVASSILFLPSVGMYYGLHEWTSSFTNGVVDAKFIAVINTSIESPLAQVSMIPLLVWIAKNAPAQMKATFFAVFASFTNLALSASALTTKYLNQIFVVTREVKDKLTGEVISSANYSELGFLLILIFFTTLVLPIGAVLIVQKSRFKTTD